MGADEQTSRSMGRGELIPVPLACGLLALLTLLLNLNALGAFFVGDDYDFLLRARGMDGLGDALRSTFWGEWEPAWWISWYLDFRVWELHPLGYHLSNTLLLALAVVALFGLVRETWPESPRAAWSAALLFATHPLHDEAVVYLAARGHVMATGLGLSAMWLYARQRRERGGSRASRMTLLLSALSLAALAALAKETALTLPLWAGALAWAWTDEGCPPRRTGAAVAGATGLFLIPAAGTLALRQWMVGLHSDKLTGALDDVGSVAAGALEDLPEYALLGGAPLPFGFVDAETLERFRALGWTLVAVALLIGVVPWVQALAGGRQPARALRVYLAGLCIAAVSLGPVLWAGLSLRRRYLFTPSVGIVLAAAALLHWLAGKSRRAAWAVLLLALIGGGVGTLQRNDLYRRSGAVARAMLETVRQAPLDRPPAASPRPARDVVLLTLPRAWGGDYVSGAYLLHHTDLLSALHLFGVPQPEVQYALKCYHADDYSAQAAVEGPETVRLEVSFRTRRAFEAALRRDPEQDGRGGALIASLDWVDPASRRLRYSVRLRRGFRIGRLKALYVYSDGNLELLPVE